MSRKLADFESAIESLRGEKPDAALEGRLIDGLRRRRSPRFIRPIVLACAASVVGFAVWPRGAAGSAWAQSVAASLESPNIVRTGYFADGKVCMREMRSGRKEVVLLYDRTGAVMSEWRTDGKRKILFFDMLRRSNEPTPPNARKFARIFDATRQSDLMRSFSFESIDQFIDKPGITATRKESPAAELVYDVVMTKPFANHIVVHAEAQTKRIQRIDLRDGGYYVLEYPAKLDGDVFTPRLREVTNVETYDLQAQKRAVVERIKMGLGTQGPVTLRIVTLDYTGGLWALWTGAAPDSKLSHPMRMVGVKATGPFGLREFTTSFAKVPKSVPSPVIGRRLEGMAVVPQAKIGPTVDLDIPYPGGVAHFRKVPVMRIAMLRDFQTELGMSRASG